MKSENDQLTLIEFLTPTDTFKKRVPVRVKIGKWDLLSQDTDQKSVNPWYPVWIHSFATGVYQCLFLCEVPNGVNKGLDEYGNYLNFKKVGQDIFVYSSLVNQTARTEFINLVSVWREFGLRVRDQVVQKHPEFVDHPQWRVFDELEQMTTNSLRQYFLQLKRFDSSWFEEDEGHD